MSLTTMPVAPIQYSYIYISLSDHIFLMVFEITGIIKFHLKSRFGIVLLFRSMINISITSCDIYMNCLFLSALTLHFYYFIVFLDVDESSGFGLDVISTILTFQSTE
ncbi:hypothetical protein RclHR1_00170022 [Rhizophagus clarus]|uniref:Uncharacterized protein n=1 Tax=Rhizophagus clarus TaxID=94130 RepID=A0A2Z6RBV5_9GLOM|nr:hypothetical protein RclHR1_00170022 [Rhizophagus clarus]